MTPKPSSRHFLFDSCRGMPRTIELEDKMYMHEVRSVLKQLKGEKSIENIPGGVRMALSCIVLGALFWAAQVAILSAVDVPQTLHYYVSNYAAWSEGSPRFKRSIATNPLPRVKQGDLNNSIVFGEDVVGRLARLEMSLANSDVTPKKGSPNHGLLIQWMPEQEALQQGRDALVLVKASVSLMQNHCLRFGVDQSKCAKWLQTMKAVNTQLGKRCPSVRQPAAACKGNAFYRSIDGSCNHVNRPSWGKSFSAYRRLIPPHYDDGVQLPRGTNRKLPSSRQVSSRLAVDHDIPDDTLTLAMMQWTQFVEHDLVHTPTAKMVNTEMAVQCCQGDGGKLTPRYVHPLCLAITVADDDPVYSRHRVRCMSYVRSVNAMRSDCSFGPSEQLNQATPFLDGSHIYGSTSQRERSLRSFTNGQLLMVLRNGRMYLPPSDTPQDHCQVQDNNQPCYKAGDTRANMHPHLTAMHTIWAREHNRVAAALLARNPEWDDEKLYQEARRIVIAELQYITYNQWLPLLLGTRFVQKIGFVSMDDGYSDLYHDDMDPSVSNAFASAGMRFVNSMMQGSLQMFDNSRTNNETLHLRDHFHMPQILEQDNNLDKLVRGLSTQSTQQIDLYLASDLTSQLFRDSAPIGLDIFSLDIQRGRDHGLPGYNHYRKLCGLKGAKTFDDFTDVMSNKMAGKLKHVYSKPDDVDLLVGALAEEPREGALFGPTLRCIVSEQMLRAKRSDRYFYNNKKQPYPFTREQIAEIQKTSLSRILCDNADDVTMMQPDAFTVPSERNPLTQCTNTDNIPAIDFSAWQRLVF